MKGYIQEGSIFSFIDMDLYEMPTHCPLTAATPWVRYTVSAYEMVMWSLGHTGGFPRSTLTSSETKTAQKQTWVTMTMICISCI